MLDDQPDDVTGSTDTGSTGTSSPASEGTGSADSPPTVKKTTRKRTTAPAKKAAPVKKATAAKKTTTKKAATAKKAAAPASGDAVQGSSAEEAAAPVVKKTTRKRTTKKVTTTPAPEVVSEPAPAAAATDTGATTPSAPVVKKTTRQRSTTKKAAAAATSSASPQAGSSADAGAESGVDSAAPADAGGGTTPLFQPPVVTTRQRRAPKAVASTADDASTATQDESAEADTAAETSGPRSSTRSGQGQRKAQSTSKAQSSSTSGSGPAATDDAAASGGAGDEVEDTEGQDTDSSDSEESSEGGGATRRRRRRGGRRRRKPGEATGDGQDNNQDKGKSGGSEESGAADSDATGTDTDDADGDGDQSDEDGQGASRRRRRRRRAGEEGSGGGDDPRNTVTRVRQTRSAEDQITAVSGSTRLEAKKQRRREGREAGRRRAPIVSEAEFLARREAVDRAMVLRQRDDLTQIAVLEDKVLVEHYVARESQTSLIGNVYLGRVQNVLPSMEAAFIDIGKGRNAVLYAGEVNWSALGHKDGQPRKIESVLSSGQPVLVQVTKDPVGHKGARLTSQVSLAGRFLVYVPDGTTSGISRKLPDTERSRLKTLLKEIVPDTAGVIVRTAAEGASEDELTRDVERLKARWEDIEKRSKGSAPQLLYGEPDLTLKVVRDLFTEDFTELVIQGDDAWETVQNYVAHVAPDLEERLSKYEPDADGRDVFSKWRIDEQIKKGLDRKVWLPSGGSLVIDRTEAMTVVDVNTGKFTGSGGNLEETVTKNNLEAAEEIVRQLRLRDIGGIIVVDFIDMVLESNRDLVVRRLVECLGRDRTRHQVAEVTSLGLVQMTRKKIGTGLLEAFSHSCEHCQGRGVLVEDAPVDTSRREDEDGKRGGRRSRGRGRSGESSQGGGNDGGGRGSASSPSPKDVAAMARPKPVDEDAPAEVDAPAPAPATDSETPSAAPADPAVPDTDDQPAEVSTKPAAEAPPEAPAEVAAEPATEPPKAVSDEAPAEAPAQAPAEAPRVVTRTRRRSASRPAGPPVAPVSGVGNPPSDGVVEPGTGDVEPGVEGDDADAGVDAGAVAHVPVKRKGSRKR